MEEEKIKVGPSHGEDDSQATGAEEKKPEQMSREELIELVRQIQNRSDQCHDLYLRSLAEVENIKKRAAKERDEWVKHANDDLVRTMLPALDNLEIAITHTRENNSLENNSLHALREGVELTLRGLKDSLGKFGVQEIEAPGALFDPHFHEAVYEVEDDRIPSGTVVQELQKGYTSNGRLIRPSRVVVSRSRGVGTEKREETLQKGSM